MFHTLNFKIIVIEIVVCMNIIFYRYIINYILCLYFLFIEILYNIVILFTSQGDRYATLPFNNCIVTYAIEDHASFLCKGL
jgi:hypothetical protein